MFNAAQLIQTALGFFRTVKSDVTPEQLAAKAATAKPKKVRKIGYGATIQAHYDTVRFAKRNALKELKYANKR